MCYILLRRGCGDVDVTSSCDFCDLSRYGNENKVLCLSGLLFKVKHFCNICRTSAVRSDLLGVGKCYLSKSPAKFPNLCMWQFLPSKKSALSTCVSSWIDLELISVTVTVFPTSHVDECSSTHSSPIETLLRIRLRNTPDPTVRYLEEAKPL